MQARKEKIGVVLPNHLGDLVMATPALRSLRRGRPDAEIHGLVPQALAPVLGGSPWLDRLWLHDVAEARGPWTRFLRRVSLVRQLPRLDCVLVLPNSFASALLAFAVRARQRIGYARGGRDVLLSDPIPAPREGGEVVPVAMERYYLDLVARLGCADTGTTLELFTDDASERECDALFAQHGIDRERPLVCLAPGAGYGPSKIWPLEYVAQVARGLLGEGVQVALVHAPGEESLAERILAESGPGLASLGGEGMHLALLKSILARANLLICNDAGARHIAAAFECPALVLMGPTSIRYTNLNLKRTKLLREPVDCSPCQLKVCPIDHRCMTRLRPERVFNEARAALRDEGWRGDLHLELGS